MELYGIEGNWIELHRIQLNGFELILIEFNWMKLNELVVEFNGIAWNWMSFNGLSRIEWNCI